MCAGRGLIVAWGAVGCGWAGVGCVLGVEVEMVSGRVVAGCWFPVVVVLIGGGVVGAIRLVADVAPLAGLRRVAIQVRLAADVLGGVVKLVVGFGGVGAAGHK